MSIRPVYPEMRLNNDLLRRLITASIVIVTILATIPILVGRWPLVIPYWYGAAPLVFDPLRVLSGCLVIAIYLVGNHLLARRSSVPVVGWCLASSVVIPVTLLALVGDPLYTLFTRTVSSQATGGFTLGRALTPEMLHDWPQLMLDWRPTVPHIAISLPGWPLLYYGLSQVLAAVPNLSQFFADISRPWQCHTWDWGLNQASNPQLASAWLGVFSPLWAALTVIPLYRFGQRMVGEAVAREAVRWWPLVPALTLFAGTLNTFYPLLTTLVLYFVWRATTDGPGWPAMLRLLSAGLLIGGLLLLSLSLIPLLLFVGLLVLLAWQPGCGRSLRGHVLWSLAVGAQMGIGLLVVAGAYAYWTGHSPVEVFQIAMRSHLDMHRSYLPSLGLHIWDFAIYSGLAATGLALVSVVFARSFAVLRLVIAFGLTTLILLISGSAQGEVGRVWVFFVPLLLLLAGITISRLTPWQRGLVLGAQVLWLVVMVASHKPVDTWMSLPPAYAEVAGKPLDGPFIPTNATFGDQLRLAGFQSQYHPDQRMLSVALHWQPLRQMAAPYYFSVVPVAPDGRALSGMHWQPFGKRYPTTCWHPDSSGAEVVDKVDIALGDDASQGNWWLSLSVFAIVGDRTLPPLSVRLADGSQDRQFGLGPLPVETR